MVSFTELPAEILIDIAKHLHRDEFLGLRANTSALRYLCKSWYNAPKAVNKLRGAHHTITTDYPIFQDYCRPGWVSDSRNHFLGWSGFGILSWSVAWNSNWHCQTKKALRCEEEVEYIRECVDTLELATGDI